MRVTTQEVDFGKREINYSFIIRPLPKLILTGNFGPFDVTYVFGEMSKSKEILASLLTLYSRISTFFYTERTTKEDHKLKSKSSDI